MPSGIYQRTLKNMKHYFGKGNPFYGKHHTKESKELISLGVSRDLFAVRLLKTKGYREIKIGIGKKWQRLSRYLVEKYIGRKLTNREMIHHIDGNPMNDKLNNLYLFKNMGLHLNFTMLVKYNIIDRFILKSNLKEFKIYGAEMRKLLPTKKGTVKVKDSQNKKNNLSALSN